MIPIFLFISICSALGITGAAAPGLFSRAQGFARARRAQAAYYYHTTAYLTQQILLWATVILVIWGGLLAFSIYTGRLAFAIVGFVSAGLAAMTAAILLVVTRKVVLGVAAHLNTTATAWSAAIPMQTVPWHAQPAAMRFRSLLSAPFYGLYMMLVFPAKGVLEIIKAVASFAPTLGKWMERLISIVAAISVSSWFLTGIVAFQLEFGMAGPLDLFILGLTLVFIATLVASLLMMDSPMIKVLEFIQTLGFINLLLLVLTGLHHFRPELANPLVKAFTTRWAALVSNVTSHDWIAMLVLVGISGVVCRMPWCRMFAGPLSLGLLALWVFSTDLSKVALSSPNPFYLDWQWWVTFVALLISWLFMKKWENAATQTASAPAAATSAPAHATPATPASAATPAAPAATAHGHGSHGGGFNWKPWLVGAAVIVALILLGMIAFRNPSSGTVVASATTVSVTTAPASAAMVRVNDPGYTQDLIRDFQVLKSDPAAGEYEFLLDARVPVQLLPVVPAFGETWKFSFRDAKICALSVPCVGPEGQVGSYRGTPGYFVGDDRVRYKADEFPVQDAVYQEAVAYTGSGVLKLGNPAPWVVSAAAAGQPVSVGFNIRTSEVGSARGGAVLVLKTK